MTSTDRPLGEHHYTDEEMHNEDVAYEHSDVTMQTILAYGTAILALVAFSAALMYGLFIVFEKQAEARDPQPSPVAAPPGQTPQGPQLLTNEPSNLRQFRQEEASKLDGGGWMDQKAGIAHVPIDIAKKLVLQHGLPARAAAAEDDTEGTNAPAYGESSGGRRIPVKHGPAGGSTGPQPPASQPPAQEIKK
jgi:hypothetical protein